MAALVETYADPRSATIVGDRAGHVAPAPAHDMVVDVLDAVIYALDVAEGVTGAPA